MKRIIHEPYLTFTKRLRQKQTPWECKLWQYLRAGRFYGLKFKRQVQIGRYVVDFSCREKKLVIELDGGHHNEGSEQLKDFTKQYFLEREGYKVLHFWNNDIDANLEGVLEVIVQTIKATSPQPSPHPPPLKLRRTCRKERG